MIKKGLLIFCIQFYLTATSFGQDLNLNEYEIYIHDTLISKLDFITNSKSLDSTRLKVLTFKSITDGQKSIFYLTGTLYGKGEIKNKKENGIWTYWHENGTKAREGSFVNGKRIGSHKYWYPNGTVRGSGNFKNDKYEGKWIMFNEEGSEIIQIYKDGKLINK